MAIDPYQAFVYSGPVKDEKGHSTSVTFRLSEDQRGLITRLVNDPETPWDDSSSFIRSALAYFCDQLSTNVSLRAAMVEEIHMAKAERLVHRHSMIEARTHALLDSIERMGLQQLDEIETIVASGYPAAVRAQVSLAIERRRQRLL